MKYEMIECPECKGSGEKLNDAINSPTIMNMCVLSCLKCEGTGKIKSDYIRIDDSVEAILFIGKEVIFTNPDNYIWPEILYAVTEDGFEDVDRSNANEIKVHKSVVKAVCNNTRDRHILIWGICDPEVTEFIEWYHTGV